MKIHITTPLNTVKKRVQEAVETHPDVSLHENIIYLKDKPIARYEIVFNGVEVTVIDRPWYISKSLIESRLRELFA